MTHRSAPAIASLLSMQLARLSYHVFHLWQEEMLKRRREWHRRVEACDSDDRAIQIVECLFIDNRGNFAGQTAGLRVLMQQNHLVSLLYGLCNGLPVER